MSIATQRTLTAGFFLLNGAGFATWASRIPAIQSQLKLSHAMLGSALLFLAIGSILAMQIMGVALRRFGAANMTRILGVTFAFTLMLPAFATSMASLCVVLTLFGALFGAMDVAMNALASEVEIDYGRPIMVSFHAMYSSGGLLGALAGSALAGQGVGIVPHFVGASLLGALGMSVLAWRVSNRPSTAASTSTTAQAPKQRISVGLMVLAGLAFAILITEGAMADWSAVYLAKVLHAAPGQAALAFATFSVLMAAGRFAGDWLNRTVGAERIVQGGIFLTALGLGAVLLGSSRLSLGGTLFGFGVIGLGVSCLFPNFITLVTRLPNVEPGPAIAMVATFGYSGFLVGPPLLGAINQLFGLPASFACLLVLNVVLGLVAGIILKPRQTVA